MEFDNLSFNWRSADDEYALSKNTLEILTASGALLGTLVQRCGFYALTNRLRFHYDVGDKPSFARAEALDTVYSYWLLSLEDGTLTQISPSSLDVYLWADNRKGNGFEFRRRGNRDGALIDFRFESLFNLFGECNRLRGKWGVILSAPDIPDTQLTDLDTQLARLEFADESMGGRSNIVISNTLWHYEDEGECSANINVVFEGQYNMDD